jgi:hypothetical protein
MSCQISLGPNDDFEVITPSGRRVYIPVSPHALRELWQVVWNSTAEPRERASGPGPAAQREAERRAAWAKVEAENAAWNEMQEQRRAIAAEARVIAAASKRKAQRKVHGVALGDLDFTL